MKIGFLLPTLLASTELFPDRIFAPRDLAIDTIDGLVEKGHEVTVFATPDFRTKGKLVAGDVAPYAQKLVYSKLGRVGREEAAVRNDEAWKRSFEIALTTRAYAIAKENKFDIMHSYHDFLFTPHYIEDLTGVSTVYTLHDPLPPEGSFEYHEYQKFTKHNFVSISHAQRRSNLKLNFVGTVYHGVNTGEYPFSDDDLGYLLFMGRLAAQKGPHTAIQVAIQSKLPLEMGTNFPDEFEGDHFFATEIAPYLDNPLIHEPGLVSGKNKKILYSRAKALLFPIEWEEPFGMVMIEAMACGTPVVAFGRGSVPEIVKDGVTGFIVDPKVGIEGMVAAVKRLGEIDRAACRRHVEQNFSVAKMTEGYERIYTQLLAR
jgi:glycosyltransferase involved in cell wall biosynthesis